MIYYRQHSNRDILTPPDLLLKAYNELGADFELHCEDKFAVNKPHWALDNFRCGGSPYQGASHLFYTQPSWGIHFIRQSDRESVKLLTYAIDEDIYPEVVNDQIYDIGFIGNVIPGDGRQEYLDLLKSKYKCFISSEIATKHISEQLSKCKILFNHIRYEEINIRFFEALASGAQICSYTPNLHLFAEEGKHYLTFKSQQELIDKIDFLLANEDKRKSMRREARKEVLRRHTYKHRIEEIQNFL